MFQVLYLVPPLGIPSNGWLPAINEMCLRPDSNSDHHVCLRFSTQIRYLSNQSNIVILHMIIVVFAVVFQLLLPLTDPSLPCLRPTRATVVIFAWFVRNWNFASWNLAVVSWLAGCLLLSRDGELSYLNLVGRPWLSVLSCLPGCV